MLFGCRWASCWVNIWWISLQNEMSALWKLWHLLRLKYCFHEDSVQSIVEIFAVLLSEYLHFRDFTHLKPSTPHSWLQKSYHHIKCYPGPLYHKTCCWIVFSNEYETYLIIFSCFYPTSEPPPAEGIDICNIMHIITIIQLLKC